MQDPRPYVLTIAGFDPCSGAGLTADIKTFEQLKVYGLAICTGWTLQTEDEFHSVEWREIDALVKELEVLLTKYKVQVVKFGIVPSVEWITTLGEKIKSFNKSIRIIVDPVWKSSTGFDFASFNEVVKLKQALQYTDLLTPNKMELSHILQGKSVEDFLQLLSAPFSLLIKGGHDEKNPGTDWYYSLSDKHEIHPFHQSAHSKHGSGCVLSAAIASYLAKGYDMLEACREAKKYTETFLSSNPTKLGYHVT